MLNASCLIFTLLGALAAPASEDGAAWISKSEARLYRWQKPGSIVRFEVKTDVLDVPIASMEHDLQKKPDPDATRLVEALKKLTVHAALDTGSGALQTNVDIPCDMSDARVKATAQKFKNTLSELVRGAFAGLPLNDPTLVGKGASVIGAEIQGDFVAVTLEGKNPGDTVTLNLNRRTSLPSIVYTPGMRMSFEYEEVVPGHFAPSKVDVQPKKGQSSSAEYTWQKFGNIAFPGSISVTEGTKTSHLSFVSVTIEPRK